MRLLSICLLIWAPEVLAEKLVQVDQFSNPVGFLSQKLQSVGESITTIQPPLAQDGYRFVIGLRNRVNLNNPNGTSLITLLLKIPSH